MIVQKRGRCDKHNRSGCICLMTDNPRNKTKGWKKISRTHCLKGHLLSEENTYRYQLEARQVRRCRVCANEESNKWQISNPDRFKKSMRDYQRRLRYGVTEKQCEEMLEKQGGVCAICGLPPTEKSLCVDHDHVTGKFRGLLHRVCNTGIGNLKDSAELCRKAANYLERTK